MNAQHLPAESLEAWAQTAASGLGIADVETPVARILDVAADVAHGVARPAAPLSTFLLGVAFGRSGGGPGELEALAARLSELANDWSAES